MDTTQSESDRPSREKQRVALVITGQLFRFSFNTTALHVVRPNVKAGHSVHVFVYLSRDDCRGIHNSDVYAKAHKSQSLTNETERRLEATFKQEVSTAPERERDSKDRHSAKE